MVIRQKPRVNRHSSAHCPTHSRTHFTSGEAHSIVDEPIERGGTNKGPAPTDTLIAALSGCTNVITHKIAYANDIHLDGMDIEIDWDFDTRGVQLIEEIDTPFTSITLKIVLKGNISPDQIIFLQTELKKYCPLAKLIRAAGTQLNEEWSVAA
jgi:putative redox protein